MALPTSSPDSWQGMPEKIYFQGFVRKQSLELEDLFAQN
jgi:hypothetical protein